MTARELIAALSALPETDLDRTVVLESEGTGESNAWGDAVCIGVTPDTFGENGIEPGVVLISELEPE